MTKPQYKLLALDLDGTLITDDLVISPSAKAAIAGAVERGVAVTLATGRMFRSTVQFARELNLNVPLICYQGAMVRHSVTGQTIYHQTVPFEIARRFITICNERGYYVQAYVDDRILVPKLTEEAGYYAELSRVPAEIVGDLLEYIDRPERAPTKLVIVTSEELTRGVVDEMQAAFGDTLYVTRSHPRFTEGVNPACNKGAALAALAQSLDIPREQVIAVGDNLNDLPMLVYAGLSVAPANAYPEVKAAVDYVTEGVVSEGVVEVIERFIF